MFVKWTSVSTCGWAFLLYFVKIILYFCVFFKDKLICPLFVVSVAAFCLPSTSGMFCSPDQTTFLAVWMEQWYWDSWISSQCNWTQVKRNQSLWEQCAFAGLAWLKELQRLRRVCECFYSLFLFNQLNSTKSTEWIYKQIHFSKKILHAFYLYIQILCLWSALCMSNTILTVLLIIFKCSMFSLFSFLSFFLSLCCSMFMQLRNLLKF